jgi:regulator of sigma E protease
MDQLLSLIHIFLSFSLVIGVIVFIHEGGHFLAARMCGVKVETFSIGFGRELIGRTDKHGTRWKLSLLPLGGYVKMFGDAGAASTPDDALLKSMNEADKKISFHYQPLWAKFIIVAAGPLANFLLTIAVFTYLIFSVGVASTKPIVGDVLPGGAAFAAGIQSGDRVLKVDAKEIHHFSDISDAMMLNLGTPVVLTIQRGDTIIEKTITPIETSDKDALNNSYKRQLLGIKSQQITYQDVGVAQAILVATEKTYDMCASSLKAMGQMIRGDRSAAELKGPLGIAQLSGSATKQGDTTGETVRTLVWFIALLSANLGLVNLLPIPMLDGGHLMFYILEAVRGRPLADKFQEYSMRLGFSLLVCLMAFSLFNDVRNLFAAS